MEDATPSWQRSGSRRFIIADDNELMRIALRWVLETEGELEFAGEAANGREALDLCRRLQPDLALIDVEMPEMDGLEATRALKQSCPATSVIIVSCHENPHYLLEAFSAGASGYVLKDASRVELMATVWKVLNGESTLNEKQAIRALEQLSRARPRWPEPLQEHLTPRERDVLRLVVQGQTNREIAFNLSLSAGTVKTYVERIIAKMGAVDRTHAAVRAVELGLFDSESR